MNNEKPPRPGDYLLATIAARVNARERRSRADSLEHARQQGRDLIDLKRLVKARGVNWEPWVKEKLEIGLSQAKAYMAFAETPVTGDLAADWEAWQRAQGNRKPSSRSRPKPDDDKGERTLEDVDECLVTVALPEAEATELGPLLEALRETWGVPSATVHAIRLVAEREGVARG